MWYISRKDIWEKDIKNSEKFKKEIISNSSIEIKTAQSFYLYKYFREKIFKRRDKQN